MVFGENLRTLRIEKGLTLRELSEALDISYSALGKYERNEREPDFETLEKFANYFGVMIDYLIGRTDVKTFDEFVFRSDVRNLEDQLKVMDPEIRKLVVDIIDSTYLLVNRHASDKNTEILTVFRRLYSLINRFDIGYPEKGVEYENDYNGIQNPPITALSPSDLLRYTSFYKNEINSCIDKLANLYIKEENSSNHFITGYINKDAPK
ncbi:helix-turn-helix domain-containing protein [Brevibacillus formosus]|uniref:helix-turn-helix domain-containing protein n=1 Tax=Brevibacillus formosus TaxID=54913 RepID=UPI003F1C7361